MTQFRGDEPYLFLEDSEDFPLHWQVSAFSDDLLAFFDIGKLGLVSVFDYPALVKESQRVGAEIYHLDDPARKLEWYESLSRDPGVQIVSDLPGTQWGFFPFQVQALNFIRDCEQGTYLVHSTGCGKTCVAEGTILMKKKEGYDFTLYINKPNNLTNAQRKLVAHTGIESITLPSLAKTRRETLELVDRLVEDDEQPVLVCNAEKLRDDKEWFKLLVEDRRVLVVYDEVPTKLANRATATYRATAEVLYTSFSIPQMGRAKGKKVFYPRAGFLRPAELFGLVMSATPIINSPEDFFNVTRMFMPGLLGSVTEFHKAHAGRRDRWGNVLYWRNLELLKAKTTHIVHYADKDKDPEIAKYFPKKLPPEIVYCDIDKQSDYLYSTLLKEINPKAIIEGTSVLSFEELLATINCFQLICSNPRSVLLSATKRAEYELELEEFLKSDPNQADLAQFQRRRKQGSAVALKLRELVGDDSLFTDKHKDGTCLVSKMQMLRSRLEGHPDKAIVFSALNEMMLPFLSEWLDTWDISHVVYTGKQDALDAFRTDPNIQVFLSSDIGRDSIDLPEASLTIDYDLPWTWDRLVQRHNRQDRIDSLKKFLRTITLIVPGTIEDRKVEIIDTKMGYHLKMFGQKAEDNFEQTDLIYLLTGERANTSN